MQPVAQLDVLLAARPLGLREWVFPEARPEEFHLGLAATLMEFCCETAAAGLPARVVEQGEDAYVACAEEGLFAHFIEKRDAPPAAELYERLAVGARLPRGARRVWFAGHGIGALLALEAARRSKNTVAVYTFGSPRGGEAPPTPVFRIVNGMDIAATLPPPWNRRHVGRHILIRENGRLNLDPGPVNRWLDFARQTLWLGSLLRMGLRGGYPAALNGMLARVLDDHHPNTYVERLRALAAQA